MKIILFEGIDKVGKTTTLNNLYDYLQEIGMNPMILNVPYMSSLMEPGDIEFRLEMTTKAIDAMSAKYDDSYVCLIDRLHISEKVYGKVLRDGNFAELRCNILDYKLSMMNTLLVHVIPDNIQDTFNEFKDTNELIDGLTFEQYRDTFTQFAEEVKDSQIKSKFILRKSELNDALKLIEFLGGTTL